MAIQCDGRKWPYEEIDAKPNECIEAKNYWLGGAFASSKAIRDAPADGSDCTWTVFTEPECEGEGTTAANRKCIDTYESVIDGGYAKKTGRSAMWACKLDI
jgi:hypothetical protein